MPRLVSFRGLIPFHMEIPLPGRLSLLPYIPFSPLPVSFLLLFPPLFSSPPPPLTSPLIICQNRVTLLKQIELYRPTDCWKYFNRWCHIQCLFNVVKLQFHQVKVLTTDGKCSMLTSCFLLNMLHCWVQKLQEMKYVSKHMCTLSVHVQR